VAAVVVVEAITLRLRGEVLVEERLSKVMLESQEQELVEPVVRVMRVVLERTLEAPTTLALVAVGALEESVMVE